MREQSVLRWHLLAAAAGVVIPLLIYLNPDIKPHWIFAGVVSSVLLVIGMRQFPAIFLAPVLFVSGFKAREFLQPAQSQADLTVVTMGLLYLVVLWNLFFGLIVPAGWSIPKLLAGQWKGVAAFFLFAGIVALSYTYSPAPDYGWTKLSRFVAIGGGLFLSPLILVKQEKDFRHFTIVVLCLAMVLATQVILKLLVWNEGVSDDVVFLLGMTTLLALYYNLFESRHLRLLVRLVCIPWLVAGMVTSANRSSLLSLVLALGVTTLVLMKLRQAQSLRATVAVGLVILALVAASGAASFYWFRRVTGVEEIYQVKTRELLELSKRHNPDSSAGARLAFYRSALRAASEKPAMGLGVGGWTVYYLGQDSHTPETRLYPHNLFLEVAAEEGLLGLAALTMLLVTVTVAIKRIFDATGDHFVVVFSLVVFFGSISMFIGDLDGNRLLWFWCGMTFAISRMVKLGSMKLTGGIGGESRRFASMD